MKLAIRIFNLIILALSAVATIMLFATPTLSFNSYVAVDVKTFSAFVPETEFSHDIDITELIGTDKIAVGVKFKLNALQVGGIIDGNKNRINEDIIGDNIKDVIDILHEPVDLITDYLIKTNMKRLISEQITSYVDQAREKYASESGIAITSTTEDILDEVGIDDEYFTNFSLALYDAIDSETATTDSAGDVLFTQIDDALAKAEETGMIDTSVFSEDSKEGIKSGLVNVLTSLNLVEPDSSIKRISQISYVYLASYIKEQLTGKVEDSFLERKVDESIPDYADRLLNRFVIEMMPDMFYQVFGYVALGLIIGLFVFAFIWVLLFLITIIKTFTRKPWTIFGPWFWIIGSLQIILGIVLTALGKIALPMLPLSSLGLPISKLIIAPRTFALVPSILYLICIPLAFIYGFFKRRVKRIVQKEDDREEFEREQED